MSSSSPPGPRPSPLILQGSNGSLGNEDTQANPNPETPSQAQINQTKSLVVSGMKAHDFVSFVHPRSASNEKLVEKSDNSSFNNIEQSGQATSSSRVLWASGIVNSSTPDEYDTIDTSGVEKILENEGIHDQFNFVIPPQTTTTIKMEDPNDEGTESNEEDQFLKIGMNDKLNINKFIAKEKYYKNYYPNDRIQSNKESKTMQSTSLLRESHIQSPSPISMEKEDICLIENDEKEKSCRFGGDGLKKRDSLIIPTPIPDTERKDLEAVMNNDDKERYNRFACVNNINNNLFDPTYPIKYGNPFNINPFQVIKYNQDPIEVPSNGCAYSPFLNQPISRNNSSFDSFPAISYNGTENPNINPNNDIIYLNLNNSNGGGNNPSLIPQHSESYLNNHNSVNIFDKENNYIKLEHQNISQFKRMEKEEMGSGRMNIKNGDMEMEYNTQYQNIDNGFLSPKPYQYFYETQMHDNIYSLRHRQMIDKDGMNSVIGDSNINNIINNNNELSRRRIIKRKNKQLNDNRNQYLSKKKCIPYSCDPQGSRHLQTVLDTNTAEARRVRNLYINEIVEESKLNPSCLCEPILHPYGNYVVQRVITSSEGEETSILLNVMKNYVFDLSMNQHGTRSIQCLVEKLTEPNEYNRSLSFNLFNILLGSIKTHIATMICDNNGNHVINKILKSAKAYAQDNNLYQDNPEIPIWFFQEFVESCIRICEHQHGCCVYQNAIDRVVDDSNSYIGSMLINVIADNCTRLIGNKYGNYVVQYCLESRVASLDIRYDIEGVKYNTCDMICKRLLASSNIYELCKGKCQSNVIEQCITQSSNKVRRELIQRILVDDDNMLLALFTGEFSNYVIQTIAKTGDTDSKERIERLVTENPQLKTDVHARGLLALFKKTNKKKGMWYDKKE